MPTSLAMHEPTADVCVKRSELQPVAEGDVGRRRMGVGPHGVPSPWATCDVRRHRGGRTWAWSPPPAPRPSAAAPRTPPAGQRRHARTSAAMRSNHRVSRCSPYSCGLTNGTTELADRRLPAAEADGRPPVGIGVAGPRPSHVSRRTRRTAQGDPRPAAGRAAIDRRSRLGDPRNCDPRPTSMRWRCSIGGQLAGRLADDSVVTAHAADGPYVDDCQAIEAAGTPSAPPASLPLSRRVVVVRRRRHNDSSGQPMQRRRRRCRRHRRRIGQAPARLLGRTVATPARY